MKIEILYLLFSLLLAHPLAAQEGDAREIITRSLERDRRNDERARDYTYVQRVETRQLDGAGRQKSVESDTFDVTMVGERHYSRKVAHNDKPLPDKDARRAQQAFDREFEKRSHESEHQRRDRLQAEEKNRKEERAFREEIPQAFDFRMLGVETLEGRPVWHISATPRAGYRGHAPRWEMLTRFKGQLWIDQQEYQWVRVDAESIAPVSFGWVLARLKPGAHVVFQQSRVNAETWLPESAVLQLDARLGLVKRMNMAVEVRWKDYRKFRTDSRLLDVQEAPATVH